MLDKSLFDNQNPRREILSKILTSHILHWHWEQCQPHNHTGLNLIVRIKAWLVTSFQPHYQPKIGKQALTFHFKISAGSSSANVQAGDFAGLQWPEYLFFSALAPASEQLQQVRLVYTMCTVPVRTERLKTKQVSFISHHVFTSYIYIKNISLKPLGH